MTTEIFRKFNSDELNASYILGYDAALEMSEGRIPFVDNDGRAIYDKAIETAKAIIHGKVFVDVEDIYAMNALADKIRQEIAE